MKSASTRKHGIRLIYNPLILEQGVNKRFKWRSAPSNKCSFALNVFAHIDASDYRINNNMLKKNPNENRFVCMYTSAQRLNSPSVGS